MRILGLQRPRRRQGWRDERLAERAVINPSGDDRPIGIAVDELNDNLMADTRRELKPPLGPRPILGNPDPCGSPSVLVVIGRAIPRELDPHPAVLVGANVIAARSLQAIDADNERRVRSAYFRLHR